MKTDQMTASQLVAYIEMLEAKIKRLDAENVYQARWEDFADTVQALGFVLD